MCGFAGIIAWDDRHHITRPALEKMSARIAHRGPDGQGMWLSHESEAALDRPEVGLVHRRLAILDLDPRANQPFTDGRRWIVFNGEIYNFRELRSELTTLQPNYAWRTTCDTEVLLVAYDAWGERCVDHFNGMFAFAVWDEPQATLYLARDRMGQKPLYMAFPASSTETSVDAVAFASELPALLEVPWVERAIDNDGLLSYLQLGYASPGIFRGVRQLKPGEWMRIRGNRTETTRYFRPDPDVFDPTIGAPKRGTIGETVRDLVRQAVARRLVADVPLGCFLSGGVDSSVIAAAMTRAAPRGQPVMTFAIGFDDPRYDETSHAAAVAKHLGTQHREFTVRPDAATDLPRLAAVFGEPFGDSSALPTHYLARETRQFVKVALSGDGGDELFGGYDRYRAMWLGERFARMPGTVRRVALSGVWQRMPGSHPKSIGARAKRLLASLELPPPERYAAYMAIFGDAILGDLLQGDLAEAFRSGRGSSLVSAYRAISGARDGVQTSMALDRATYLPHDLLTKVDRCSMLHALEVRSPYMDHELVQFVAGLGSSELFAGSSGKPSKRLLRDAFAADLPAFVFKRKKMGFAVPIGEWFRGELRGMLRDHLFAADSFASQHFVRRVVEQLVEEHEQRRVDHSQRLYALLMLELWSKTLKS